MIRRIAAIAAIAAALGGCGTSPGERALTGAGIGAASGAAVGAVTDLDVSEGALIGGAAGALIGAVTDRSQVDLGRPVWRNEW